jgi:hypothetical protein
MNHQNGSATFPRVPGKPPAVTPAQTRFARHRHAQVGNVSAYGDGSVFLYHQDGHGTVRWLVDRSGSVLDFTRFHDADDAHPVTRH